MGSTLILFSGLGLALSIGILIKRFFDIGEGFKRYGIKGGWYAFLDFVQDVLLMLAVAWLCSIIATASLSGIAVAVVGIYSSVKIYKRKKERESKMIIRSHKI